MQDLSNNNCGAVGACYLAEALKVNRGVEDLCLSGNKIGDPGVIFGFAVAIQVRNTIAHLLFLIYSFLTAILNIQKFLKVEPCVFKHKIDYWNKVGIIKRRARGSGMRLGVGGR